MNKIQNQSKRRTKVEDYNPPLDPLSAQILTAMNLAIEKAKKENQQLRRKRTAGQVPPLTPNANKGLTLIELLVVISIMVMLVAVSVPMFKPMFESQRTKNAAQTVAAAFQRVRFKAMEENASVGIQFVPYENNNTVSLQMRLVKQGSNHLNPPDVRVRVSSGTISFYLYNTETNAWDIDGTDPYFVDNNVTGYKIRFARQGKEYTLASSTTLEESITLPDSPNRDAMEYSITSPPRLLLASPVVMPRGTVVDLQFSNGTSGAGNYIPLQTYNSIIFTPNGYVDYFDGRYVPFYGGLIYVCVGEWDRQIVNNVCQAEDGKNNIETLTNYWVTLNPMTGQVRTTPMAVITSALDIDNNGIISNNEWLIALDAIPNGNDDGVISLAEWQRILDQVRKFATENWGISE